MNKKVERIFDIVDREVGNLIYVPPFIIWFIFKYFAVGFFGTETLMNLWKKEKTGNKIFQYPGFLVGLFIAMVFDFLRLVLFFIAEIPLIFIVPIWELRFSYRNKLDVKVTQEPQLEQKATE